MAQNQTLQTPPPQPNGSFGFKSVAKVALLPGILPKIKRLANRFGEFLHMFTMIFGSVGLIDKNHPCLRPENAGLYRFVDIIGLAANNVVFDKKHIPQIIAYFSVIFAIVICIALVVVGALYSTIFINDAHAQFYSAPTGTAYTRQSDWAFMFLQNVFGETGIGNLIWTLSDADPGNGSTKMQGMLRAMLKHYAFGLLILAVFQLIYIIVITLAETAQTGKPFGQKFNNVWAPIRLALAIGLMVPISAGYNSAQLIVFQMADWGSSLATNVWRVGLNEFKDDKYLQTSSPDKGYRFIRALWLSEVCMASFNSLNSEGKNAYKEGLAVGADATIKLIGDSLIRFKPLNQTWDEFVSTIKGGPGSAEYVFMTATSTGDNEYMVIQYGTVGDPDYCGSFRIPKPQGEIYITTLDGKKQEVNKFGQLISNNYSKVFGALRPDIASTAKDFVSEVTTSCHYYDAPSTDCRHKLWIIDTYWRYLGFNNNDYKGTCRTLKPFLSDEETKDIRFFVTPSYRDAINNTNTALFKMMEVAQRGGWASAGAYYMTLSYANGALSNAISTIPTVISLPAALANDTASPVDASAGDTIRSLNDKPFSTLLLDSTFSQVTIKKAHDILEGANKWFLKAPKNNSYLSSWLGEQFYESFNDDDQRLSNQQNKDIATNQTIKPLVYEAWTAIRSGDVNPLGSLVAMGSRFMTAATVLYGIGIAGSTGLFGSSAFGSLFLQIGTLFGLAGFALALYLPLLPFIYFSFAVIEWIMGILEAVIGMPLWAMSMITVEGDGLGRLGQQGFLKLVGIMLQPTVIVISLIASLIMFSAAMTFFNGAFALFTDSYKNTAGGGGFKTGGLEGFGANMIGMVSFSFLYAFASYSIGQSCFKIINKIPDTFTDWIGAPKSFSAGMDAGLAGVNQYVGMTQLNKLSESATQGIGNSVKGFQESAAKRKTNADILGAYNSSPELQSEFGSFATYKDHIGKMQSSPAYKDAYERRNRSGSSNAGNAANSPFVNGGSGFNSDQDTEELRNYNNDINRIESDYGTNSDQFRQAEALYKYQTGHDYKDDITPENVAQYKKYRTENEAGGRKNLEGDMLRGRRFGGTPPATPTSPTTPPAGTIGGGGSGPPTTP